MEAKASLRYLRITPRKVRVVADLIRGKNVNAALAQLAYVKKKLGQAGISKVEIERAASKVKVNVHTARPGIVIGKRGAGIESIKKELQQFTQNEVFLNIVEVRKAETDAQLVAENITTQLERRIAFRRAMKKAIQTAQKFGAKGIRVACSGRLG